MYELILFCPGIFKVEVPINVEGAFIIYGVVMDVELISRALTFVEKISLE